MANAWQGNTYYIDTQYSTNEELVVTGLGVVVTHVIITATAASARVVLKDAALATKLDLRLADANTTCMHDFSENPIAFQSSIRPTTLSNAVVTCILSK